MCSSGMCSPSSAHVVEAGHANGAWVGVCGEAADDPTVAAALVRMDIDELSMSRVAIPEVTPYGG
jgi:phosphotransferase system enzyme I (PtsI)